MAVQNLYASAQTQRPALQRIRRLSLPFELIFAAIAALISLMFLLITAAALAPDLLGGVHVRIGPEGGELMLGDETNYPASSVDISDFPLLSRLAGLLVMVGILGSQVAAFFCLYKLFGAYRRGIVFADASMRWMRRAGCLLIAAGVAPLAFQPLVHAAGLLDENWLQGHYVAYLVVGAALFVIASIIALGRDIEKETEGYV